jgi:hypothetical protein
MQQQPSIGRIVHYQSHGSPNGQHKSLPRAAVITETYGESTAVGLCILNPTGFFFTASVPFDEAGAAGTWRWPPRV